MKNPNILSSQSSFHGALRFLLELLFWAVRDRFQNMRGSDVGRGVEIGNGAS